MNIGRYTYGAEHIKLHWETQGTLTIGSFCSIADNINIYLGGNHNVNHITTYPFGHVYLNKFKINNVKHPVTNGNVIIGNDVWIASNTTIMSGITIGSGSIIANNSHVIKDVEPYTLIGGNPSKFIKYRFDKDDCLELLKIAWWNWDDDKINDNVHLLCSNNIKEFIRIHKI